MTLNASPQFSLRQPYLEADEAVKRFKVATEEVRVTKKQNAGLSIALGDWGHRGESSATIEPS